MVSVMGKRGLFLVWLCLVSILPGMAQTEKLIDYVNPFVGTDGYGNVYPGAQIPFGGIQMSPDTDSKYYDAASGYKYNHSTLLGFSLTHLSGTGIPDLGDFLFIPGTGEMKLDPGTREEPEKGYRSRYSHEKEWASPNYYAVELSDYGVKAEMTSGLHILFPRNSRIDLLKFCTCRICDHFCKSCFTCSRRTVKNNGSQLICLDGSVK